MEMHCARYTYPGNILLMWYSYVNHLSSFSVCNSGEPVMVPLKYGEWKIF